MFAETFENGAYLLLKFECKDVSSTTYHVEAKITDFTRRSFPQNTISIRKEVSGYTDALHFEEIKIFGLIRAMQSVTVNGTNHEDFSYDSNTRVCEATQLIMTLHSYKLKRSDVLQCATLTSLQLNINEEHDIKWTYQN